MAKPLVIYHGNCADGFTAAWLFNMWYAEEHPRIDGTVPHDWIVDHHPGIYGKPPPDVAGREVYILDFSYKRDTMRDICDAAASVTLIDHHASAIRDLQDFEHPNLEMHLDDSRCGAWLTSKFLWPDREPSRMVELVDDRDRWVFRDKNTRPFHASLFSRPYAIGEWNAVNNCIPEAIFEGHAIDRKHHKDIAELLTVTTCLAKHGEQLVAVANLPYTLSSDAGHKLLANLPGADFAAVYYIDSDGYLVFSLRSRKDGPDVSKIAESFGGGGHPNASGFRSKVFPFKLS